MAFGTAVRTVVVIACCEGVDDVIKMAAFAAAAVDDCWAPNKV